MYVYTKIYYRERILQVPSGAITPFHYSYVYTKKRKREKSDKSLREPLRHFLLPFPLAPRVPRSRTGDSTVDESGRKTDFLVIVRALILSGPLSLSRYGRPLPVTCNCAKSVGPYWRSLKGVLAVICDWIRDSPFYGGQIFQSQGLVSIDRSVVAALLSTTPRLTPRSSANDLAPLHCTGIDVVSTTAGRVLL